MADSWFQAGPLVRPHPFPQYFPAGSDFDYGHLGHDVLENQICNRHLKIQSDSASVSLKQIQTLHQI